MIDGIILKGIGGFYYVKSQDSIYECRARGKFRKDKIIPLVGDRVKITVDTVTNQGVVEEIMDRDTELIRPPVANVNQAIIVFAIQHPEPNLTLLDRFLVLAESQGLDIIICFNKMDLHKDTKSHPLKDLYQRAGYKVIGTSTKLKQGLEHAILKEKITVFAGPSGVGKSSLLNAVQPNLALQTGEISQKNERGKHTTRHVELLELDFGGWVLDTPGFSSLNLDFIDAEELHCLFLDFQPFIGECRFNGCIHLNEPECAVKQALLDGEIPESRYRSYIQLLEEIKQKRRY